jgi:hypothetical protein
MPFSTDQAIISSQESSRLAREQAGERTTQTEGFGPIRKARVVSRVGGSHTVEVLGTDNSVVDTISGVPSFGEPQEAETLVALVWLDQRPIPTILGIGSAGIVAFTGNQAVFTS